VKLAEGCRKKQRVGAIERRVGRILEGNSRAAGLFKVEVKEQEGSGALVKKVEAWRQWAELSEGCYLLRSNINNWDGEEPWQAYIPACVPRRGRQLTEAEAAFRVQKGDLQIRPIWHQKERVQAHILVCFLAYVLWKTLDQMCKRTGLGKKPR